VESVDGGTLSTKEAARRIFDLVAQADFSPPANRLGDPAVRCVNQGSPATMLRTLGWLATSAPPDVRAHTLAAVFGV
jgi:hypothetical protein